MKVRFAPSENDKKRTSVNSSKTNTYDVNPVFLESEAKTGNGSGKRMKPVLHEV